MSNLVEDMKDAFADLQNPEDSTMPEGWDSDKVKPIDSEDGVVVPVPIGYTASSAKDENTVNGGFVIYEGNDVVTDSNVEDAKKNRNQFVWVPVDDIDEIAKVAKDGGTDSNGRINYQGKLYDFSTNGATEKENYGQGTTSYREPDIVNEDYTDYYEYVKTILGLDDGNALKTQLQEEFNEMVASVKTYGGFYIGRYETGNLASNTTEPVVIKENASISDVNWYYIYQNSKKIAANGNVKSTMIWGSMYDRTLIWLTETGNKTYYDFIDSSSWGNYYDDTDSNSGTKKPTGTSEEWKANNIYDIAGNVWEWTIEVYDDTYGRTGRGRSL